MKLILVISDDCEACERAKDVIEKISIYNPQIKTETIHINSYKSKPVLITPALFIDEKLFCYGDFDENILSKKIN